jgi:hypothetical protein
VENNYLSKLSKNVVLLIAGLIFVATTALLVEFIYREMSTTCAICDQKIYRFKRESYTILQLDVSDDMSDGVMPVDAILVHKQCKRD